MQTEQQILDKAFQKAYDNGWRIAYLGDQRPTVIEGADPSPVIFRHDFAKALWGTEMYLEHVLAGIFEYDYENIGEAWQYHLQQTVIADNPIKYLGENI